MHVSLNGKRVRVSPSDAVGKGGEADIFRIDDNTALKIFKPPTHPDFTGAPQEQRAAEERIRIHQVKLPMFPNELPEHIITPLELARDSRGDHILGYSMRYLKDAEVLMRYADRKFRETGITNETVTRIFLELHKTTKLTHARKVVVGDFNDLNVLVLGDKPYIIDADSFQFGNFFCTVFTEKFVDPLLCDPKHSGLTLVKPYNENSDWFAFTVMLMQCLLYVGPYGGVYLPKNPRDKIPQSERPLKRITVFHPDVKYPKPALPYSVLPDELLGVFHKTFIKDVRGEFPSRIIESLRWTTCALCSTVHARNTCPKCKTQSPASVRAVTQIRGTVVSTRVFKTSGKILFTTVQNNTLLYVYHENGKYLREDASVVSSGVLDPHLRFRIRGETTLLGKNGQVITLHPGGETERIAVDSVNTMLPVFDANPYSRYWIHGGKLMKDGTLGHEYIGDVLSGQTIFWVGTHFGFGFYRAGNLSVYFVFDANRKGINDEVKLPAISGHLIDAQCFFTSERAWVLFSMQIKGKTIHRCAVIKRDGTVEGMLEGNPNDIPWLANITGKCAAGNFLFSATDNGIVRVEPQPPAILVTKEFPDTEPFVDEESNLFASREGLYAVESREIRLLKIT